MLGCVMSVCVSSRNVEDYRMRKRSPCIVSWFYTYSPAGQENVRCSEQSDTRCSVPFEGRAPPKLETTRFSTTASASRGDLCSRDRLEDRDLTGYRLVVLRISKLLPDLVMSCYGYHGISPDGMMHFEA